MAASTLRRRLPAIVLIILLGAAGVPLAWNALRPIPPDGIQWRTDYASALAEAKASNKPVLLDFSATWCSPCQEMERSAWPTAAVREVVNGNFIPVHLDVDSDAAKPIVAEFGVRAIPALFILSPGGGVKAYGMR